MVQRILATLLIVLGLAGIGLGVASATVWRGDDTVVAEATPSGGAAYVVTDPGVLDLVDGAVSVRATVPEGQKVTLVVGREVDVLGWVGEDPYDRVTGLADWDLLAVTPGAADTATEGEAAEGEGEAGDADAATDPSTAASAEASPPATEPSGDASAPAEGEAADGETDATDTGEAPAATVSGAEPAGNDMWFAEASGESSVTLRWSDQPGRWTLLAASVGDGVAPPTIELTWPRVAPTPYLWPGVLGGVFLLLLGVVVLLGARRVKRRVAASRPGRAVSSVASAARSQVSGRASGAAGSDGRSGDRASRRGGTGPTASGAAAFSPGSRGDERDGDERDDSERPDDAAGAGGAPSAFATEPFGAGAFGAGSLSAGSLDAGSPGAGTFGTGLVGPESTFPGGPAPEPGAIAGDGAATPASGGRLRRFRSEASDAPAGPESAPFAGRTGLGGGLAGQSEFGGEADPAAARPDGGVGPVAAMPVGQPAAVPDAPAPQGGPMAQGGPAPQGGPITQGGPMAGLRRSRRRLTGAGSGQAAPTAPQPAGPLDPGTGDAGSFAAPFGGPVPVGTGAPTAPGPVPTATPIPAPAEGGPTDQAGGSASGRGLTRRELRLREQAERRAATGAMPVVPQEQVGADEAPQEQSGRASAWRQTWGFSGDDGGER